MDVVSCILTIGMLWTTFAERFEQACEQRAAVAAIERSGGLVFYDYQVDEAGFIVRSSKNQGWLREYVGKDFLANVVQVSTGNGDGGLPRIGRLAHLKRLSISTAGVTDADIESLRGLTGLEELDLSYLQVTDASLKHLQGVTQLRTLKLWNTNVTDEGVQRLQQALPNCEIQR